MANVAKSQWLAKCKRVSNVDALSSANVVNGSSDDAAAAAIGECAAYCDAAVEVLAAMERYVT